MVRMKNIRTVSAAHLLWLPLAHLSITVGREKTHHSTHFAPYFMALSPGQLLCLQGVFLSLLPPAYGGSPFLSPMSNLLQALPSSALLPNAKHAPYHQDESEARRTIATHSIDQEEKPALFREGTHLFFIPAGLSVNAVTFYMGLGS